MIIAVVFETRHHAMLIVMRSGSIFLVFNLFIASSISLRMSTCAMALRAKYICLSCTSLF